MKNSDLGTADQIYRSGIEAARQADSREVPVATTAAAMVGAALRRWAGPVQALSGGTVFEAASRHGVIVTSAREPLPPDPTGIMQRRQWINVHVMNFGSRTLHVRTIGAPRPGRE